MGTFIPCYPLLSGVILSCRRALRMAKWLDIDALAQYLGVPKSTLYKLQQRRELPSYKLGRKLLFDAMEIDEFIKSGKRKPTQHMGTEKQSVRKSKAS
jgi:excisionase family DNA binding protein